MGGLGFDPKPPMQAERWVVGIVGSSGDYKMKTGRMWVAAIMVLIAVCVSSFAGIADNERAKFVYNSSTQITVRAVVTTLPASAITNQPSLHIRDLERLKFVYDANTNISIRISLPDGVPFTGAIADSNAAAVARTMAMR